MPAAPVQARSRARRELLVRAAIDLIADGGVRSVSHRAVAARAGLPPATTTYFFTSIDELIGEALALHVTERAADLAQVTARAFEQSAGDPAEVARLFAADLVARPPAALTVQYELYLEAGRDAALAVAARAALGEFEAVAATALRNLGLRDPDEAAVALLALVDGFSLHRVVRPRPPAVEVAALAQAMVDLLAARLPETTGPARE